MPSLALYEYFSRSLSRDLVHTVFARLIKAESLVKLNMFGEAIGLIESIQKADRLPTLFEDKVKNTSAKSKYVIRQNLQLI
jgi:hypothetical protein